MLATLSFSFVTARSSSPSERFTSCSGTTKLPVKRSGYCATHSAALSLQRMHRSRSVCGSAQDVPCSTVLEVTTLTSMPRASMSSISSFGSNMRCMSCAAPGRGAGIGFAPKPVNTVLLVEALNTLSSSMCTWKSTTRGRSCFTSIPIPGALLRLQVDVLHELRPACALVLQELREILRRSRTVVNGAELAQPLRHLGVGQHLVDVAVQLPHGLRGRARRRDQREPADVFVSRVGFGERRYVFHSRHSPAGSHRDRPQLAALDERRHRPRAHQHHLRPACDRVLQRRRDTVVRYLQEPH